MIEQLDVSDKGNQAGRREMGSTGLKVLIADDERIIAQTLALILELNGYISKAVYSGEDAVAAAGEFCPDALVSDVIMGGMTGVEAALQIREMCPDCRVILFSGQATMISYTTRDGKVLEIFSKPLHPETVLRLLRDGRRK